MTGAGFTKNFGGLLGSEMWAEIFNNPKIQNDENLRKKVLGGKAGVYSFNYEEIYDQPMTNYEKDAFTQALSEAYQKMDKLLVDRWTKKRKALHIKNHQVSPDDLRADKLLGMFQGKGEQKGYFFTLNQDLFVERYMTCGQGNTDEWYAPLDFIYPLGRKSMPRLLRSAELNADNHTKLPMKLSDDEKKTLLKNSSSFYIKLHGSYGWKVNEGDPIIIVSSDKEGRMKDFPVLTWQLDLFEEVLKQGDMKLFIIGYGFMDEHINNRIFNAARNSNLKVFILSRETLSGLIKRTAINQPSVKYSLIGDAKSTGCLGGYFNYSFEDLLSGTSKEPHPHLRSIEDSFFGGD